MNFSALFFILFFKFWFFFGESKAVYALDPSAEIVSLAASDQWRALLYFNGEGSAVPKGSSFFLSPQGNTDAFLELQATLKAFQINPVDSICKFPARALFLQKALTLSLNLSSCARYAKWKEAIQANGIEVLLASAYLGSPSSMYGHLLLKFKRTDSEDDLLDYTLNYGADSQGAGGLGYVLKGLTGGFMGFFSTAPYYVKIKEYDFLESRDFWSYRLNFSAEETEFLIAHAWEVREVSLPYYFLSRNCAYYVFLFLRVVRPQVKIPTLFSYWTIPVDVIRAMYDLGWVSSYTQRASRKKKLQEMKKSFTAEEKALISRLAAEGGDEGASSPLVADAAYELHQLRIYKNGKEKSDSIEQKLLQEKQKFPLLLSSKIREVPPQDAHPTARVGASMGKSNRFDFAEVQIRLALHDMLSHDDGYSPNSDLEMGKFTARYQNRFYLLEQSDVLHLESLEPIDSWIQASSWMFLLGTRQMRELDCENWNCFSSVLRAGWGKSFTLGSGVVFARGIFDLRVGVPFDSFGRVAVAPQIGVFQNWKLASLLLTAERIMPLWGDKRNYYSYDFEGAIKAHKNWELRGHGKLVRSVNEGSIGLFHFF